MNNFVFLILISISLNSAYAEDKLKSVLQNYPTPTPEQILTVGFKLQDSAISIMEQENNKNCDNEKEKN